MAKTPDHIITLRQWAVNELERADNKRTSLFVHRQDLQRHQVRAGTLREVIAKIDALIGE